MYERFYSLLNRIRPNGHLIVMNVMKKDVFVPVGNPVENRPTHTSSAYRSIRYDYTNDLDISGLSVDDLIASLTEMKEKYTGFKNLYFMEINDCRCYGTSCSCRPKYRLYGKREETDLEYEIRLHNDAVREDEKRKRDEAEFARLAKALGKNIE